MKKAARTARQAPTGINYLGFLAYIVDYYRALSLVPSGG
jgi:hypothetical protein